MYNTFSMHVLLIVFTCTPVLVPGASPGPGMLSDCLAGGGCEISSIICQLTNLGV